MGVAGKGLLQGRFGSEVESLRASGGQVENGNEGAGGVEMWPDEGTGSSVQHAIGRLNTVRPTAKKRSMVTFLFFPMNSSGLKVQWVRFRGIYWQKCNDVLNSIIT